MKIHSTFKAAILLYLLFIPIFIHAQNIRTNATINSVGYYIDHIDTLSASTSISVKFKENNGSWRNGYEPSFISVNSTKTIAGSLFELKAGTSYSIQVDIIDSLPILHTFTLNATATTQAEPTFPIPSDTLWVSATGTGNAYTFIAPGKFDALFKTDYAKIHCGTTILCKSGTYYVGELNYTASATCGTNNAITISAAPNENVIFDGSDTTSSVKHQVWSLTDATNNIYSATLPAADAFSTLLMLDSTRLFPYAARYPIQNQVGQWLYEVLSNGDTYFGPGFYRNKNNFYVRLKNGQDPNGKAVTVSRYNYFMSVSNSNSSNLRIILKNLTMRFYSRAQVNYYCIIPTSCSDIVTSEYPAHALQINGMSNTLIDNCSFAYNSYSIVFNYAANNTIIQNCSFKDQTGTWMHGQFKNTALTLTGDLAWLNDNGKFGRDLEVSGIFFEPQGITSKNIMIRNNTIDGIVSGIGGRADAGETVMLYDVDVSNNTFVNNYDAMDQVGNPVNYRIWGNKISRSPVNISMIGSPIGPVYIFRNIISEIVTRKNPMNLSTSFNPGLYVNYNGCEGPRDAVWGSVLKLNAGGPVANPRHDIHFIHNTIIASDSLSYNIFIWQKNWRTLKCINNAFYSKFNILNFEGATGDATYNFTSTNDNYFSEINHLGIVNPNHGTYSCYVDNNLDSLWQHLRLVSGNTDSATLKFRSYNYAPGFVDLAGKNYNLMSTSALVNKGVMVNNISDLVGVNYFGSRPDIGALEYKGDITQALKNNITDKKTVLFPNPGNGSFTILSSNNIESVIILDVLGRQLKFYPNKNSSNTIQLEQFNETNGVYFAKVQYEDNSMEVLPFVIQR